MSLLGRLGLKKLQLELPSLQQRAPYSSVSEFIKNVKSAVDSNPEIQKTVDQLRKSSETLTERAKSAAEDARKTASEAFEQSKQQAKSAAGISQKDAENEATSSSSSSSDEEDRRGQTPDSEQNASTSGRSEERREGGTYSEKKKSGEERREGGTYSEKKKLGLRSRLWNAYNLIRQEVEQAVLPKYETQSATRARDPTIRPASGSGSTGIAVVKQKDSRWQKQWSEMQAKLGLHPIFKRLQDLSDNQVFNKGREVADDIRERWETSDSAVVQRLQDMKETMFTETEPAQALREIRTRYPAFDMVAFMRLLKGDVPLVIKAYLNGDLEALREHCSKEMMERFSGIVAAQKAEGLTTDPTILDVSDVELVDLKFVENNPVVVVQFNCQQINCSRDRFGNVVEGGPQQVQRVYYYWALQQEDAGFVGEDGSFHPPRWQLREMMVRGMHNLL